MSDFNSILGAAQQLGPEDRLRLIDALWATVPPEAELPLHADWGPELEKRVAALEAGTTTTIPWSTIRAEALARIGHGTPD